MTIALAALILNTIVFVLLLARAASRSGQRGYQPQGPPHDWRTLAPPTGGSAIQPPPPIKIELRSANTNPNPAPPGPPPVSRMRP